MQRLLCHLASAQATAPLLFHHFTDGSDKEGWAQGQFQLPVGVIPFLLHQVKIGANVPSACGAGFEAWGSLCSQAAAPGRR